jgi:hypothetical protein
MLRACSPGLTGFAGAGCDAGLAELLDSGRYRVEYAEEAVLPVVATSASGRLLLRGVTG